MMASEHDAYDRARLLFRVFAVVRGRTAALGAAAATIITAGGA
jgi:hypothetical protein